MTRWWRSTIRLRLMLLYAVAFFLGGAVLIGLTYIYLGQSLQQQAATGFRTTEQHIEAFLSTRQPYRDAATNQAFHAAQRAKLNMQLAKHFEQQRLDIQRGMLTWSLASLGVVGLVAGGLGWMLAGRALRPLQQITATARRVADRSLHERIALEGPNDEIKNLADTFDAMLERLDRSFDGQRRFVANASHELRTPLTLNRTLIEVALDAPDAPDSTRQLGAKLLAVNQSHERLIDGLLVLATGDQRLTELGRVDLADIARHATSLSDDAAREAGVQIRRAVDAAPVVGDRVLLERLVQNLLDNGIRYNVAQHGLVWITTGVAGGYACLSVENTGPTVPDEQVDELFEPFHRLASADRIAPADPSTNGRRVGLGLSIVRSVAHAHGGDVHASPRPTGGLTVRVRIPIASSSNESTSVAGDGD